MNAETRFWSKVQRNGGCWPWLGSTFRERGGYGKFQAGESRVTSHIVYAHRFAYELTHGPIPAGMHVLHRCDHPVCCNPDHLWLGTAADNSADMVAKGRQSNGIRPRGERHPNAKYSDAQVAEIRRRRATWGNCGNDRQVDGNPQDLCLRGDLRREPTMTYVWIDWLADALRAEGCKVSETSGWKTRGRPSSSGSFNPYATLWHHTGTTSSSSNPAPTLQTCIQGRSDLPGPLCHVLIGYDGVCHIVAAGRANHAGQNRGSGPIPAGDGNAQMVGFEIDYDGTQAMSSAQYDAATRASVACIKKFARSPDYCRRHQETSTTGKWDTGGVTGEQIRSSVTDYMQGDDMPSADEVAAATWNRALGHEGFDMEVALQRIYTWCDQMQKDLDAIKSELGIG